MKIGILTFHSSINYGAYLQSYSFQQYMKNRYKDICIQIINYTTKRSHNRYLDRILVGNVYRRDMYIRQYNAFIDDWNQLDLPKNILISDSISEFEEFVSNEYDIIIVGSDELWRTDGMRGFPNAYWLNMDMKETTVTSFAVSGRSSYGNLKDSEKKYIKEALEKYDYIGVRDEITRYELEKCGINREIYLNPDPTLLYKDYFRTILTNHKQIRRKYGLDDEELVLSLMVSSYEMAETCNAIFSKKYKVCNLYEPRILDGVLDLSYLGPFEWCELLATSDFIITDYYHGTLFSLIYKKRFIAIEKAVDGNGKIEDFLKRNRLDKNLIYKKMYQSSGDLVKEIKKRLSICDDNNYEQVFDSVIENEVKNSNTFLTKLDNIIIQSNKEGNHS